MTGQSRTVLQPAELEQDRRHAAAKVANRHDYGTLILDRLGRVVSCGEPAERIFGAGYRDLAGKRISQFIDGLFPSGTSPSHGARYLVYRSGDGDWRRFKAKDVNGQDFTVELSLSRMATKDRELFLLNVRRPHEALRP
jgi:PAS domain S-box-containing protein